MEKTIVRDVIRLSRKALPATREDLPAAQDLLDTLRANSHRCVGMAANMIGVNKCIIAVDLGGIPVVMLNPVIVQHSRETYEAMEGCLCHEGTRPATRFQRITVRYEDTGFRRKTQEFSGFAAQIIQHEMDHLQGILI